MCDICILPLNTRKQRIPNLALSFSRNKPIKFDHVCDHGEIVQKILVISVFNFEQQAYLSKVVCLHCTQDFGRQKTSCTILSKTQTMEFDSVLTEIGEFGPWQVFYQISSVDISLKKMAASNGPSSLPLRNVRRDSQPSLYLYRSES